MIKQSLIFLLSLSIFASCKEEGNGKGKPTTSDTVAIKEETILSKYHPVEEKIAFFLSEIERFRGYNEYDSLAEANKLLMKYLTAACADESLLQYPFDSLNKYRMTVLTSEDKKFRIYCWNTETGGTMRFFNSLIQYKTTSGTEAVVLNDIEKTEEPGNYYREIYTVHAASGNTYYLVTSRGIYSSRDIVEGIQAYTIEKDKLNDSVKLFRTAKQQLNDISYACDFFSNIDSNTGGQRNLIRLSDDKQTLFIPVVNDKDEVTEKSLIYKFDGTQFVYDKNAK